MIQAFLNLIARFAGKIFSALFGWAVVALFGQRTAKESPYLSAVVGAAAVWPLLILGTIAPRLATLVLALVPIPDWVEDGWLRAIWIFLALLVPFVIGIVFERRAPPRTPRESRLKRLLRGIPITLAVAAAFLFLLVSVPIRKIVSMARRLYDEHVPLIVEPAAFRDVQSRLEEVLDAHGFAMERLEPTWVMKAPSAILTAIAGDALQGSIPTMVAYLRGPSMDVVLQPNGVTLRGDRKLTARAHGLIDEALTPSPALQSGDAAAQAIEKEIKKVWKVYEENPAGHRGSAALLSRVDDIALEIVDLKCPYEDWQVVYRQALQRARTLRGEPPLLFRTAKQEQEDEEEREMGEERNMDVETPESARRLETVVPAGSMEEVPLGELIRTITEKSKNLIFAEVKLAKAEIEKDLRTELAMVKRLAIAAVSLLLAIDLLLVAAVFALSERMPGWMAALVIAAPLLLLGIVMLMVGWKSRVGKPLEVTRESVKESVEWAKSRLA